MPDADRIPLPPGLPTHLCVDKEGYEALCSLLAMTTRERRQALANAPVIKRILKAAGNTPTRQGRTAERIRQSLLALYGDPIARRQLWLDIRHHESTGDAGPAPFPSLEHAALTQYDASLLIADPNPERFADIDAFCIPEVRSDNWRAPALAAIPRLKQDFADWSSIPPSRRLEVLTAAFAAASLVDDARLLRWAADREDDIARAYSFLGKALEVPNTDAEQTPSDRVGDLPARLRDHSLELRDAANDLAEHPATGELFDVLTERYAKVLELREPVLAWADADAVGDLIDAFATLLDEKASIAPWLTEESESLLAAWREAYLQASRNNPEQLRADIDRAVAAFAATLPKAAAAQADENAAKKALENHEAAIAGKAALSRADRQQQVMLLQKLATARQAVVDAMDEVIAALTPNPTAIPQTAGPTSPDPETATPDTTPENSVNAESPPPRADAAVPPEARPEPEVMEQVRTTHEKDSAADLSETTVAKPPLQPTHTEPEPESAGDPVVPSQTAVSVEVAPPSRVAPESETRTPDVDTLTPAQAAVWRSVGDGRLGLAYHIARLDQVTGAHPAQPSPELLAAVALGKALHGPQDDLAAAYGQRVGLLGGLDFDGVERPIRDALNLLLFVATLRPALFASQHGASIPLLRRVELSGDLTPVYRLAAVVADHAEKLQTVHLDVSTLTAILDEGVWKDRIAAHAEIVVRWREGAAAARFLFAGAGAVWQHWLGAKGILGELVRLLATDRVVDIPRVQKIAELLGDKKAIHTLIEDTDRHAVGRHGESISGRALAQLEIHLAPAQRPRSYLATHHGGKTGRCRVRRDHGRTPASRRRRPRAHRTRRNHAPTPNPARRPARGRTHMRFPSHRVANEPIPARRRLLS